MYKLLNIESFLYIFYWFLFYNNFFSLSTGINFVMKRNLLEFFSRSKQIVVIVPSYCFQVAKILSKVPL